MSSDQSKKTSKSLPWIEKYRPKKLDEVAHQDEVVSALKNTLTSGNLPHLLFYGPPGTGKTSTILAVARELYGPDLIKSRVLELNASHDRGIDVIRDKVKTFAQLAVGSYNNVEGYPCPPFKIIILDEADCMTKDAQSALRRVMETYAGVTRFCIICNYVSRIIEPITSRCAKFRYKSVNQESMIDRLKYISKQENINVDPSAFTALVQLSDGDMRKSINILQTAHKLVPSHEILSENIIMEVSGSVPESIVSQLVDTAVTGNFTDVRRAVHWTVQQGYPCDQVYQRLLQYLFNRLSSNTLPFGDVGMSQIAIRISQSEQRLIKGANEEGQLLDLMSIILQAAAEKIES